jgi:fusion and transport protein UGO1
MGRQPHKKIRKFKKQTDYHSSSSEAEDDGTTDFAAVNLDDSDNDGADIVTGVNSIPMAAKHIPRPVVEPASGDRGAEDEGAEDEGTEEEDAQSDNDDSDVTGASSGDDSDGSTNAEAKSQSKKRKRNDPTAFATSISKILNTKLTTSKRADPVLSRSKDATIASKELAESRLEAKAKSKMRTEKKEALEKGRIKDVLGLDDSEQSTQVIMEREKKLRKMAQHGVVRLFNAVREAQRRGEEARRDALKQGIVGATQREEKMTEMSKKGFLELIASGGGSKRAPSTEI